MGKKLKLARGSLRAQLWAALHASQVARQVSALAGSGESVGAGGAPHDVAAEAHRVARRLREELVQRRAHDQADPLWAVEEQQGALSPDPWFRSGEVYLDAARPLVLHREGVYVTLRAEALREWGGPLSRETVARAIESVVQQLVERGVWSPHQAAMVAGTTVRAPPTQWVS